MDGICRVSGGRADHQVLSGGRTLTGLQLASQPQGRPDTCGSECGRRGQVVLPHGACARLALVLPDKSRCDCLLPFFFFLSALSLEISFRARGALHASLKNNINESVLFMAALGLHCCVEASGGSSRVGPWAPGVPASAVAVPLPPGARSQ